ncbi:hypothetical protein RhiJN_14075 [Ceratobasidium sp. AG-Ba]|nr:hypothetical protein RhiJN_14075 [Ceratobasidium sp. AG-Ba]QRW14627.1 hypothetical protein RhiLY_13626 [Ceratobasidium sp. AG-Ba]
MATSKPFDMANLQRTRYASLSAMILLVYDHSVTFDAEVELVWFKPWTWSKALFFWNRYGTFIILLFDTIVGIGGGPSDTVSLFSYVPLPDLTLSSSCNCLRWQKFQGWTGWLTNMTVELIIQVRIAAMFSQDKRVLIPMIVLFFTQAIGMAVVIGLAFSKMQATNRPVPELPDFRACVLKGVPPRMYIYWAINLAFESTLFCLAVFKAWQNLTRKRGTRPSWSGPRILNILIRDSILYFSVIFVTYVMNLIAWSTGGGSLYQLAIALAIALRASMGSRLLLNVREAYYTCEIVISENPLSTIRWQQRNSDCVMMDSLPENSTRGSSIPGYEIERLQVDPSSSVSDSMPVKSPSKVTFDISGR